MASLFDIILYTEHENKKKCTIHPLVGRKDLQFVRCEKVADGSFIFPKNAIFLHVEGKPLLRESIYRPLVLLDASWQRALKLAQMPTLAGLEKRSIPHFTTSYPRVSKLYEMPGSGLSSVEALYIARLIQGEEDLTLLDHYYWRKEFLQANESAIVYWRELGKEKK